MSRSGNDEEDAAPPSNAFRTPTTPYTAHGTGAAEWTACRLRGGRGERRAKSDANIRGTNCCADAVHSVTTLCLHGGSQRPASNGVSCLTMPALEPPTAHLRTGHAHPGRGRRLLSRAPPTPGRRRPAPGRIPRTPCAAHRTGTAARGVQRPFLRCPAQCSATTPDMQSHVSPRNSGPQRTSTERTHEVPRSCSAALP